MYNIIHINWMCLVKMIKFQMFLSKEKWDKKCQNFVFRKKIIVCGKYPQRTRYTAGRTVLPVWQTVRARFQRRRNPPLTETWARRLFLSVLAGVSGQFGGVLRRQQTGSTVPPASVCIFLAFVCVLFAPVCTHPCSLRFVCASILKKTLDSKPFRIYTLEIKYFNTKMI